MREKSLKARVMRGWFRRVFTNVCVVFLSVSLCLSPTTHAQVLASVEATDNDVEINELRVAFQSQLNGVDPKTELGRNLYWLANHEEMTKSLYQLYLDMLKLAAERELEFGRQAYEHLKQQNHPSVKSLSEAEVEAFIREYGRDILITLMKKETDLLKLPRPGVGRAEMKAISGKPTVRIVHEATEVSFLFLQEEIFGNILMKDASAIGSNDPHLQQFRARQVIDAGRDHGLEGRDFVEVWVRGENISHIENYERPTKWTFSYLSDWYHATIKAPMVGDVIFGSFWALVHGGSLAAMGALKKMIDPMSPIITPEAVAFQAAFGFTMGLISSSFNNWLDRARDEGLVVKNPNITNPSLRNLWGIDIKRSLSSRVVRQSSKSVIHSFGITYLVGTAVAAVTFSDYSGIFALAHAFNFYFLNPAFNLYLKNKNQVWVYKVSQARSEMRLDDRPLTIGGVEIDIAGLTEKKARRDTRYYLMSWIPQMGDLIQLKEMLPGINGGRIALILSIAFNRYLFARHMQKIKHPKAQKYWDDFMTTPYMRALAAIRGWFQKNSNSSGRESGIPENGAQASIKGSCESAFR